MLVDCVKNMNTASKTYGQYYPRIFKRDGLNLKGFARHISEHGSLVKYDLAVLVLQNIVECLKEMMVQGVPVKLDGLGIFSPGIEGSPCAAITDFNCDELVKGIRINFRPEGSGDEEDKLTKKALLDQATFQLNDYVEIMQSDKTDKHGNPLNYQKRTKISQQGLVPVPEP